MCIEFAKLLFADLAAMFPSYFLNKIVGLYLSDLIFLISVYLLEHAQHITAGDESIMIAIKFIEVLCAELSSFQSFLPEWFYVLRAFCAVPAS